MCICKTNPVLYYKRFYLVWRSEDGSRFSGTGVTELRPATQILGIELDLLEKELLTTEPFL